MFKETAAGTRNPANSLSMKRQKRDLENNNVEVKPDDIQIAVKSELHQPNEINL